MATILCNLAVLFLLYSFVNGEKGYKLEKVVGHIIDNFSDDDSVIINVNGFMRLPNFMSMCFSQSELTSVEKPYQGFSAVIIYWEINHTKGFRFEEGLLVALSSPYP